MKISVYGAGYVGLVTSACLSSLGHHVCCADISQERIQQLQDGHCPIYETGLPELLKSVIRKGLLTFTASPLEAVQFSDVHFIATGTPSLPDGQADLSQVFDVVDTIAHQGKTKGLLITKSTVPVGTGDEIEKRIKAIHKDHNFYVASNPEFLREGSAVYDFLNADRIVAGGGEASLEIFSEIYQPLIEQGIPLVTMSRVSAELTKYTANTMLACRISFMNQISQLAEAIGADIEDIRQGVGMDHRIGPHFLNAGIGYGGSCFPKDSRALINKSKSLGIDPSLLESIENVNHNQKSWPYEKIKEYFEGELQGKHIALWGLAFKPGTDDMREASSLVIIQKLLNSGVIIHAFDPVAVENAKKELLNYSNIHWYETKEAAIQHQIDALLIVTEWDEIKKVNLTDLASKLQEAPIIDGRNCFHLNDVSQSGISEYISVGRPALSVLQNFKQ